jgi:hypothetical protein
VWGGKWPSKTRKPINSARSSLYNPEVAPLSSSRRELFKSEVSNTSV